MKKITLMTVVALAFACTPDNPKGPENKQDTDISKCPVIEIAGASGKEIRPVNGVNSGPCGSASTAGSNFTQYRDMTPSYARLHDIMADYGPNVDVHLVFPDFSKDETLPSSYNFSGTDALIKNIVDAGVQVFYRLGTTIEHNASNGSVPPKDFSKWARICEHIILHYNEGWANGFHYNIKYWEIWNEADNGASNYQTSPTWKGTWTSFCQFYSTAAKYLKGKFPELMIGGPAFSGPEASSIRRQFMQYCQTNSVPIDFYSWHKYGSSVSTMVNACTEARQFMTSYGYGSAESILDEWNYNLGWSTEQQEASKAPRKNNIGGSFVAAVLCAFQTETDLDKSMYYDARYTTAYCGLTNVNGTGSSRTFSRLPAWYAFREFGKLKALGEQAETRVRTGKTLPEGIYYAAACNSEGKTGILVSYYPESSSASAAEVGFVFTASSARAADVYLTGTRKSGDKVATFTGVTGKPLTVKYRLEPNTFIYIETR